MVQAQSATNRKDPTRRSRPRLKTIAGRFLLILAGISLGLLLAELILHLVGYSSGNFVRRDQVVGWSLRPGAEGWWTKEGRSYVRINSNGLRDREHAKEKPPNTVRIAIVGDSYAEALQLPMEKAFWAVMETRLTECKALPGRTIEAINFGFSGYGTAQELLTVREKVWKYDPDIVLLALTTGNDISDNSRALSQSDEIPYFVFSDGRLVLDDSFRHTRAFHFHQSRPYRAWTWIRDRSLLLQAATEVINGLPGRWHAWRAGQNANSQESGLFNQVYHEPGDQNWTDAWKVTEALVVQMRNEVEAKHAKFFVVTLSSSMQVHPDPKVRDDFVRREGITDLFYPDRRLKNWCDREGIHVLVLAPGLQSYAEQNKVFLHGFDQNLGGGHWNELGHRLAGEMIAHWLCDKMGNKN